MSQAELNYIDQLEQDAAKASGGGGIIAQCELYRGWKVFVSGLGNRESFFYYNAGDEAGRKAAQAKAKEHGQPQDTLELIVYKATVKSTKEDNNGNRVPVSTTWKDDRFFTYPLWTDGFKKVMLPSIKEHKPPIANKFWAKISFVADPTGRQKKDQNGEDKPELVAFIAQVYKDEAEATADAGNQVASGTNGSEPSDPMVPADYSKADWLSCKGDIEAAIAKAVDGIKVPAKKAAARTAAIAEQAAQYAATVAQVEYLLKS